MNSPRSLVITFSITRLIVPLYFFIRLIQLYWKKNCIFQIFLWPLLQICSLIETSFAPLLSNIFFCLLCMFWITFFHSLARCDPGSLFLFCIQWYFFNFMWKLLKVCLHSLRSFIITLFDCSCDITNVSKQTKYCLYFCTWYFVSDTIQKLYAWIL